MSLFGKLEAEVEIKAPSYKFHEANTKRVAEIPKLIPNFIQSLDLVEGEWGQKNSVMCWYFILGKSMHSWNILYVMLGLTYFSTY